MGDEQDVADVPRRLWKRKPNATGVAFDRQAGPAGRTDGLSQLAMQVIADWSTLDTYLSGLFVQLVGANPEPGAAIFGELTASATQKAALRAVARLRFEYATDLDDTFEALLKLYDRAAAGRNRIAHWVWGSTPDLPDCVLLVEPKTMLRYHVDFFHYEEATMEPGALLQFMQTNPEDATPPKQWPKEPGIPLTEIWVLEERDFRNLSRDILDLTGDFISFRNLIAMERRKWNWDLDRHPGVDQTAVRLRRLMSEPRIGAIVEARREARRKQSAAPPPQSPPEPTSTPPASTG